MYIGELSRLTGVSPRMLRYYEERGLLDAARLDNGYRDYHRDCVTQVARIRSMRAFNCPTEHIRHALQSEENQ